MQSVISVFFVPYLAITDICNSILCLFTLDATSFKVSEIKSQFAKKSTFVGSVMQETELVFSCEMRRLNTDYGIRISGIVNTCHRIILKTAYIQHLGCKY